MLTAINSQSILDRFFVRLRIHVAISHDGEILVLKFDVSSGKCIY